jgi:hypothetical protein
MQKILIISCLALLVSCGEKNSYKIDTDIVNNSASAEGKITSELPEIKFEEEEFDFGKMTQGEKVSHAFAFTNVGKKNLVISGASGSCGCTVPEWPHEPIKSGETGAINVVFNSDGKRGYQEKTVTIVTNCEPATRIIKIKAEVIVPETAK